MRSPRRGTTLAEALVAGLVLIILCMAFLNLYPGSFLAIHEGDQRVEASAIAQAAIEQARYIYASSEMDPATLSVGAADRTINTTTYHLAVTPYELKPNDTKLIGLRATVTWTYRDKPMTVSKELLMSDIKK